MSLYLRGIISAPMYTSVVGNHAAITLDRTFPCETEIARVHDLRNPFSNPAGMADLHSSFELGEFTSTTTCRYIYTNGKGYFDILHFSTISPNEIYYYEIY